VKIIDVAPDGTAYNLDESIQRMRYRDGYDKPLAWMEKGKVYKVSLQPLNTSNYFAAGHKLRIEVSSSNFPRFDRNLNTGEPIATARFATVVVLPSPGSELVTMIKLLTAARVCGSRTFCRSRRLMPRNSLEMADDILSGVISPFWRRARATSRCCSKPALKSDATWWSWCRSPPTRQC